MSLGKREHSVLQDFVCFLWRSMAWRIKSPHGVGDLSDCFFARSSLRLDWTICIRSDFACEKGGGCTCLDPGVRTGRLLLAAWKTFCLPTNPPFSLHSNPFLFYYICLQGSPVLSRHSHIHHAPHIDLYHGFQPQYIIEIELLSHPLHFNTKSQLIIHHAQ